MTVLYYCIGQHDWSVGWNLHQYLKILSDRLSSQPSTSNIWKKMTFWKGYWTITIWGVGGTGVDVMGEGRGL